MEMLSLQNLATYHLQRTYEVEVTSAVSPSLFWVRVSFRELQRDILNSAMNVYMRKHLDKCRLEPGTIEPGIFVTILHEHQWSRGVVENVYDDKAVVFLSESGTKDVISHSRVYQLQPRFLFLPQFAIPCAIHGVQPAPWHGVTDRWHVDTCEAFHNTVRNKRCRLRLVREYEDCSARVDLYLINPDGQLTNMRKWLFYHDMAVKSGPQIYPVNTQEDPSDTFR